MQERDGDGFPEDLQRAAAIDNQEIPAGSQQGFNHDDIAVILPVPGPQLPPHIGFPPLEEQLCDIIKRIVKVSLPNNCPAPPRPNCDPRQYSLCQCVNPAKYSPEGFGNCNFGSSKADKKVWCYVDPRNGDPRHVCPDAIASLSQPGWYWSRIACLT